MTELNHESTVLVGVIVAMAVALVRLIELFVTKVSTRKRNGNGRSIPPNNPGACRGLTPEEHAALMRLDDMHDRCDQDGTPVWYFPRSWATTLQEIVKTQHDIAERLSEISLTQKGLLKEVGRLENNTSRFDLPRR